MANRFTILTAIAILGGSLLTSCGETSTNLPDVLKKDPKTSLTFEATTSLMLVNDVSTVRALRKANNVPVNEETIEETKKVLPTIDLLLDNGIKFDSSIEKYDTPIQIEGIEEFTYTIKETIKINYESNDEFTLFYNEGKIDIEEESDDNEIEQEKTTITEGYAFDGTNYFFFNSVLNEEKEIEDGEEEIENSRTLKLNTGANSYIIVEQKNEVEGKESSIEFEYKVVENGHTTLDYSIELETEDDFTSIEYELNDTEYEVIRTLEDGYYVYNVELENSNDDVLMKFKRLVDSDVYELVNE